jgi:hypothetical protein
MIFQVSNIIAPEDYTPFWIQTSLDDYNSLIIKVVKLAKVFV